MKNKNYYAILMAGGVGSRFWPASTQANPKQFQDILGAGKSLIQATFERLSKIIPQENIYILTNKDYTQLVKEHLPQVKDEQIVPEPALRNTGPSILLGALKIRKKNKDALIVVAPSDHWIDDEVDFCENVEAGFNAVAEDDKLITLGISPNFPNTGYGYIKYNSEESTKLSRVEDFTEKPNFKKAEEFLKSGKYLWNAGIFIWSASFIIDSFKKHLPEMYRLFEKGSEFWNTAEEEEFLRKNYGLADNISIDYGILEKSDKVFVIPVDFKWNDLGTWGSLERELPQDDFKNTVVNSRLLPLDSSGNIISTESGKVVVLDGINDYIIVETAEVLLLLPKDKEQSIKELREKVQERFGNNLA
ncbi:mannose-1-phosphate guanylyltransferase [Salegentibacter sediminis]|uniref:mannose-1-phosphate guanylyltransferase n=1 Tax=Salegentibacter sediminis TaxID=1930251 RepID=UPI0009BD99BA|nr:mannose-1-phosphate guanylyltransferase [Salegentibacter sediminis]